VLEAEDGAMEFTTVPGMDSRPAVAKAVVNAGYDLLEIRAVGMSLEQIFLELTADDPMRATHTSPAPEGETETDDDDDDGDEE
jgi:hypothetical protein